MFAHPLASLLIKTGHYSLDPKKTLQNHANTMNLHVHVKNTHETAQTIKGMVI